MAAVKALQQWCKLQCEGYRDVSITNMTTSFRDGLAFCALIHKHRPDLMDFNSLSKENIYENNQRAFEVAEKELGIPALLDAEDMVALKVPDRLSILTYVSQYYNYFHGRSPIGGMGGIKRPAEESKEAPKEKKNAPVTAQVYPSAKPAPESKTPKGETEIKKNVLTERSNKSGTLTSSCSACNKHVHLVQRHLVDGKLYHRNCFKCKECANILFSGTYKAANEPGTFMCKTHTRIEKLQASANAQVTAAPKTQSPLIIKTDQNASSGGTGRTGVTADAPPLSWSSHKRVPAPIPILGVVDKPKPAVQLTPVYKTPETTVSKSSSTPKTATEFFENYSVVPTTKSSTSSTSTPSVSPADIKTPTPETPRAHERAGASRGRVLLRVKDWTKTQESEKEKAKAVIGGVVKMEKTNSSSPCPAGPKANSSNIPPVDSSSKGPSSRVRLKAPDASGERDASVAPVASWIREKNPSRPVSSLSSSSKEEATAPSDWRSMLKPVSKPVSNAEAPPFRKTEAASFPRTSDLVTSSFSKTSAPAPFTSSISISSTKAAHLTPVTNSLKQNDPSSVPTVAPIKTDDHRLHKPGQIPKEDIQKEMKEIEKNMNELEKRGVELEKQLRQCDEDGEEDTLMNDLMVDWFTLIRNKQVFLRRESELVYIERTQDLEEEQPSVEAALRKLMEKPEHLKTFWDRKREKELMDKLVEIVNDRNAIVEGLDEDRLREEEEDQQLNQMMQNFDMKKEKHKKKSPIARWFSMRSKQPSAGD
ncbi:hypothetical protein DNTS_028328 [Danionella cerebrum]|uniref:MICAL-like protein 2 n=2 Tax=Danionella cerebrum TaxID=2873325 RepID=A0A553NLY0_9TELE|nr:hypothetical protein DNTS_028328 [Danionella translucida]